MSDTTNQIPPFVLALTIIKNDVGSKKEITEESEILVCIRNREANATHPDVVSVPTQRIPSALAEQTLKGSEPVGTSAETKLLRKNPVSSRDVNGHDELVYIVESLLCRKLEIAEFLENGSFSFEASLAGNLTGVANYPNLNNSEQLQMLNIVIYVEDGADLFPKQTASYDEVRWGPVSGFLEMWPDGKDITKVGFSAEQALKIGVCVDGLCISSSADIVRACLENAVKSHKEVS